jgi:ppGpp synthetase/RelA/SpoT-type nucleotidyltranferase
MAMKISRSIEDRFIRQKGYADAIRAKLSQPIGDWCKNKGWLFEDRIKELESYAQKIEQSRIKLIDDVYAATIIVKNKKEIIACCKELENTENILGLRFSHKLPESFVDTKNDPDKFIFDSVRMYFKPPVPEVDIPDYIEEVFEIQIKTLLEQAWNKATHTFYKSNEDLSWAKSRLISQTKALLESAEIALIETDLLSDSIVLQKQNPRITNINRVSALYKSRWDESVLPKDLKRLAENTLTFLGYIKKDIQWFENLIDEECNAGRGSNLLNLSPYWVTVQASVNKLGWSNFLALLKKEKKLNKQKFPLIKELELKEMVTINGNDRVYILK